MYIQKCDCKIAIQPDRRHVTVHSSIKNITTRSTVTPTLYTREEVDTGIQTHNLKDLQAYWAWNSRITPSSLTPGYKLQLGSLRYYPIAPSLQCITMLVCYLAMLKTVLHINEIFLQGSTVLLQDKPDDSTIQARWLTHFPEVTQHIWWVSNIQSTQLYTIDLKYAIWTWERRIKFEETFDCLFIQCPNNTC
jgi:hypothetical protein